MNISSLIMFVSLLPSSIAANIPFEISESSEPRGVTGGWDSAKITCISSPINVLFKDLQSKTWKILKADLGRQGGEGCSYMDSILVIQSPDGYFGLKGGTLSPIFRDSACKTILPEKFKKRSISYRYLPNVITCVPGGFLADGILYKSNGYQKQIMLAHESVISKWMIHDTLRILGNMGTTLMFHGQKFKKTKPFFAPKKNASKPNEREESERAPKAKYINRASESDEKQGQHHTECFFFGPNSKWIYCPRIDGLDSFPRIPGGFPEPLPGSRHPTPAPAP